MILFKKNAGLQQYLNLQKSRGKTIGLVPTMGALHQGHLSLVESSRKENSITVSSIFVNPAQFNDPKDFEKYPITIEKDILALESSGCDVLFLPPVTEIYPGGTDPAGHYDLGYLETILEGKYRPGHFQGVCKVMKKLLEIVNPGNLYLGQKDYQQCMVIARLIELMGRADSIHTGICPTFREPDGLAMSSRNLRLNKEEREKAPVIYQTLCFIRDNLQPGNLQDLKANAFNRLEKQGFRPDYAEIADAITLQPVNEWNGTKKLVALVAAFLGEVRLIDNMIVSVEA